MPLDIPGSDNRFVATLRFGVDPYTYLNEVRRAVRRPVRKSWLAGQRIVLTGEPEHIKQILAADARHVASFNPGHLKPLLGEGSLILIDGQRHTRERRLLSPPLHGARMRSYAQIIRDSALQRARAWQLGQPFVMSHTTQAISLDVIVKAVFGVQDPARVATFERTLLAATDADLAAQHPHPLPADRPRPAHPVGEVRPQQARRRRPRARAEIAARRVAPPAATTSCSSCSTPATRTAAP
jgi:cytochrome P450